MAQLFCPPTVSVVMPAYNAEANIDEAIASALVQSMRDLELIVVDDGSTDATLAIVNAWGARDSRVRVIQQSNQGISAARNAALVQSRGRFIALLDSDDAWDPAFLEAQLSALDRAPHIAIVTGNAIYAGGPHDGEPMWPIGRRPLPLTLKDLLANETAVCIMSVFRRAVYDTIGGFDPRLRCNEDYHFWLRAAHAGFAILQTSEPLGRYRRRPDSVSADQANMLEGIARVLMEARDGWCAGRAEETAVIDRQLCRFERERLVLNGKMALLAGRFETAEGAFRAATSLDRSVKLRAVTALSRWAPVLLRWCYGRRSSAVGHATGATSGAAGVTGP